MNKRLVFPILLVVMLVILSCRPLGTPTPAPTSPPVSESSPTEARPTRTERPLPTPTLPEPQPAAAPRLHAGDPLKLDVIFMNTETRGWGLSGPDVLTTVDGGQTWSEVSPPGIPSAPYGAAAYGAFLDADTAWIIFAQDDQVIPEASVWHTTDGGLTWIRGAALLHQVYAEHIWAEFAVLDSHTIWLMVRGVYVGAGTHYVYQLFRSTDGGLTWASLGDYLSFAGDSSGMFFASENFGTRTRQTLGAYYFDPPAIELTTDGGISWDTRELPPPSDVPDLFDIYPYCETYQPTLLSTRSIRLLVGCVDSEYTTTDFVSYLYASDDAGLTWEVTLLPESIRASLYQMIYFGDDQVLLLGRNIYRSTDDGQSWNFVTRIFWDGQFSFIDDQNGWATGKGGAEASLARTDDGAESWSLVLPVIAP